MTPQPHNGILSPASISEVDRAGMAELIVTQAEQLVDALNRVRETNLPRYALDGGLLVCGMGGSAIGADLAGAVLTGRARRPLRAVRDYQFEPWVGRETLVACASYSGNTEETLACYAQARAKGLPRVVITTGGQLGEWAHADGVPVLSLPPGMQPRASVVYMLVSILACAEAAGVVDGIREEVVGAVRPHAELVQELGPEAPYNSFAKDLARRLYGTVPVIYGAGMTAAIATRWKAQFNENAGIQAFASTLPEADHNEICAWTSDDAGWFSAVFLSDREMDARVQRRVHLTAEAAGLDAATVAIAETRGSSAFERVLSLVLVGDLVSLYLAALDEVDPTPVPAIDRLKSALQVSDPVTTS